MREYSNGAITDRLDQSTTHCRSGVALGSNQLQCNYLLCKELERVAVILSVASWTYQGLGSIVGMGRVRRAAPLPSLLKEIRDEEEHKTEPQNSHVRLTIHHSVASNT